MSNAYSIDRYSRTRALGRLCAYGALAFLLYGIGGGQWLWMGGLCVAFGIAVRR